MSKNYLKLTGKRADIEFWYFDDKEMLIEANDNECATIRITEEQAKQLRDFLNEHYGE